MTINVTDHGTLSAAVVTAELVSVAPGLLLGTLAPEATLIRAASATSCGSRRWYACSSWF